MKKIRQNLAKIWIIMLIPAFGAVSCSEKAERIAADETAEQMETPEEIDSACWAGREAARPIVNNNWADTMQLQHALLEARAANSKYELEGKKKCKESFDTAFVNTIRVVRPDLANQLDSVMR